MSSLTSSTLDRIERALRGEIGRRLVHASGTAIPVSYLLGATWEQVATLYVICAAGVVVLDLVRLYAGLEWWLFEHLTREYEQDNFAGYVLYMLSSTAVWLTFDPQIAMPAILMLTLGDPISGAFGSGELRVIKRPRVLALMFLVCTIIAAPFHTSAPLVVIAGAVGGTVADGVKIIIRTYIIDDNLTIPVFAAVLMAVAAEFGGAF